VTRPDLEADAMPMPRLIQKLLPTAVLVAALLAPTAALAQLRFQEGRHYTEVPAPQLTGLAPAGKIEVTEVFSYVCNACAQFQGPVEELRKSLPDDAVLNYVHAGFNEGWQVFQRAHLTAQALGIADRNHARLFAAIWQTAEFPFFDPATGRPRQPGPVIRDFARFYAKGGGVSETDFAKLATSPQIEAAIRRTEALTKGWKVPHTPTLIVAGRYMINNDELSTQADLHALTGFLVGLERARLKKAAAAKD
jgi:thiol:disulfide interchange protein DsbA